LNKDPERRKVSIKASKNGRARILTVTQHLIDRLLCLPKAAKTVFPPRAKNTRRVAFHGRMKTLARIHSNPRFLKIHYHTFRHCKALREYHKTRSILHVKKVLGHRNIMTTQRYVELYTEIYGDLQPQDYTCQVASTIEEAKKLIEAGFEFVSQIDGEHLYRKPKETQY
jgi:integrase